LQVATQEQGKEKLAGLIKADTSLDIHRMVRYALSTHRLSVSFHGHVLPLAIVVPIQLVCYNENKAPDEKSNSKDFL
jgi:hypothetical protein